MNFLKRISLFCTKPIWLITILGAFYYIAEEFSNEAYWMLRSTYSEHYHDVFLDYKGPLELFIKLKNYKMIYFSYYDLYQMVLIPMAYFAFFIISIYLHKIILSHLVESKFKKFLTLFFNFLLKDIKILAYAFWCIFFIMIYNISFPIYKAYKYGVNESLAREIKIINQDVDFGERSIIQNSKNEIISCSFYSNEQNYKIVNFSYIDFILHVSSFHLLDFITFKQTLKNIPPDTKVFFSTNWIKNKNIPSNKNYFSRQEVIDILNDETNFLENSIFPSKDNVRHDGPYYYVDINSNQSTLTYYPANTKNNDEAIALGPIKTMCSKDKKELQFARLRRMVRHNSN